MNIGEEREGWKKVPFHDFILFFLVSSGEKKLHLLLCKLNVDMISALFFFFFFFSVSISKFIFFDQFFTSYILDAKRWRAIFSLLSLHSDVYNYFPFFCFLFRNLKSTYHVNLLETTHFLDKIKKERERERNLIEVQVAKNKVASTIFFFIRSVE